MKDLLIEKETLLTKDELYDYLMDKKLHTLLFIVPIDKDIPIGCIYSYQYNQTDGYIYTKIFIKNGKDEEYIEAFKMFSNYLFTYLPIRKIYYEDMFFMSLTREGFDEILDKFNKYIIQKT